LDRKPSPATAEGLVEASLHGKKWLMLGINLLGGAAVLGSYAWGIRTHANAGEILWGGVPLSIQPFYTAGMLLAAAGYFAFTHFILFRLRPDETRVGARLGFDVFNAVYAGILIPSRPGCRSRLRRSSRPARHSPGW